MPTHNENNSLRENQCKRADRPLEAIEKPFLVWH